MGHSVHDQRCRYLSCQLDQFWDFPWSIVCHEVLLFLLVKLNTIVLVDANEILEYLGDERPNRRFA